tara:strand:- start:211 stop:1152 length:942 start_codon:yes stop_codon:yes gene_type:complete
MLQTFINFSSIMKKNLSKFKGELLAVTELYHQLRNRCFLKTQLDVVYTDFTNWERYDLLFIDHDVEKGMWKKLNYIEYTWMKIVEQLRKFGFPYNEIKLIKNKITNYIPTDELIKSVLEKKEELDEHIPKASNLIEKHKSELSEILEIKITSLELLIYNAISYNQNTTLQFFNDGEGDFSFLSKAIYDESIKTDQIDLIVEINKRAHLSVSLNSILSKFLDSDNNLDQTKTMMLSQDEYELLKIIRNRPKSVIGINIKIKENKFERIDIESTKIVEVEARLMEFIRNGGYQTIEIVTQNGLITSFKNKEKIKL